MKTKTYKLIASTLALGFGAVDIWLNTEFVAKTEGWISSPVAASVVATLSFIAALPLAERLYGERKFGWALATAGFFAVAAVYCFNVEVERVRGMQESSTVSRSHGNNVRQQAEVAVKEAEAALASARDRQNAAVSHAREVQAAECVIRGVRCRAAETALSDALKASQSMEESELVRARAALKAAPEAVEVHAAATPLAAYQPYLFGLLVQIGSFVFAGVGFSPRARRATAAKPAKAKTKAKSKGKTKGKSKTKPKTAKVDGEVIELWAANQN